MFRYHDRIVAPEIQSWSVLEDGTVKLPSGISRATIVYADYVKSDFNFFPLRGASLVRLWKRSNIYFAALRLEDYVCYQNKLQPETFREALSKTENCPRPNVSGKDKFAEGHFLSSDCDLSLAPQANYTSEFEADNRWQKIVDALSESANSNDTLFYRVRGVYRIDGEFWTEFGYPAKETLVEPKTLYAESRYRLWTGKNYILKILFYIPKEYKPVLDIEISSVQKEGAVITPERIQILSRYNEERILIGCRRVLDRTLNPVWIKHAADEEHHQNGDSNQSEKIEERERESATADQNQSPSSTAADQKVSKLRVAQGYLLTQVEVPRRMIFGIVLLVVIASVLIAMGPDMITGAWKVFGQTIAGNDATLLAGLCKTAGAIFSLAAGYLAFRKIPIGQ